jgi:hypothetical protein
VSAGKQLPRWPLLLIAAPAAVAVWSGWVGLGGLCGFGVVHPLPGIADGLRLNTAITLPVGIEAYGAYALGAWLTPATPAAARLFARRSALGALALGMAGQVIYHLLAAAHAARAPWPVVVLVSCLPVVTLGFGAALTHLLRVQKDVPAEPGPADAPGPLFAPVPEPDGEPVPGPAQVPVPVAAAVPARRVPITEHAAEAARIFAAEIAAGSLPSIRRIRSELHVGQDRAVSLRAYLAQLPAS